MPTDVVAWPSTPLVFGIAVGLAVVVLLGLVWADRMAWDADDVDPDPDPPADPSGRSATIRMVQVMTCPDGIVVDALVDGGDGLGASGTPISLLLEWSHPCALHAVLGNLQAWVDADAVVDVDVTETAGFAAASLRNGSSLVRLALLGVDG